MAQRAAGQTNEAAQGRFSEYRDAVNSGSNAQIAWIEADEARGQRFPQIGSGKKYLFRSRPGTMTGFSIPIPSLPPDFKNERQELRLKSDFVRRRTKRDGENPKFNLESLFFKTGGHIVFRYVPGRQVPGDPGKSYRGYCYYETDDDEIYAYLMHKKQTQPNGSMRDIVVEHPKTSFEVNGKKYPATSAGWEAAQSAILAAPQESQE